MLLLKLGDTESRVEITRRKEIAQETDPSGKNYQMTDTIHSCDTDDSARKPVPTKYEAAAIFLSGRYEVQKYTVIPAFCEVSERQREAVTAIVVMSRRHKAQDKGNTVTGGQDTADERKQRERTRTRSDTASLDYKIQRESRVREREELELA